MVILETLRFPVVLFDLGSTLIHFAGDWPAALLASQDQLVVSLREAGYLVDPVVFPRIFGERLDAYRSERESEFVEHTTLYVLRNLMTESGFRDVPVEILKACLSKMYAVTEACWEVEEDTLPTLQALQNAGRRIGLVSNASDDADVQALVDKAGIRAFFDVILTSAGIGRRKPHPSIFNRALETWGIEPGRAVMVGDTLGADILGARNLEIASVWITRRADRAANRAHAGTVRPDGTIQTLLELPPLLAAWEEAFPGRP